MKHLIIIAIAILAVSASVWAEVWESDTMYMSGEFIVAPTTSMTRSEALNSHLRWGTPFDINAEYADDVVKRKRRELESRIAKLEAELRRVAALVYSAHRMDSYTDTGWPFGGHTWCEATVSFTQEQIDQCLGEVQVKEEKE